MLGIFLTLLAGYFFTNFAGWAMHKLLHTPWLGPLKEMHDSHHTSLYSPHDYLSPKYRSADTKHRTNLFYVAPALLVALMVWAALPTHLAYLFILEMAFVIWLNDYVHYAVHVQGHWLERYRWFWWMRDMHWQHHVDPSTNLGIFSFAADKLLGTYFMPIGIPYYHYLHGQGRFSMPKPPAVQVVVEDVQRGLEEPEEQQKARQLVRG